MKRSLLVLLGILFCLVHASSTWAASVKISPGCSDFSYEQQKPLFDLYWYNNNPTFKPDFCNPSNLAYRVAKAILFIKSVGSLNDSSTDKFDQGFLSSDPFRFFSDRIGSIQFDPDGKVCDGFAGAYVQLASDTHHAVNRVMHVCQLLSKVDDLTISSTLVHEARHVDGYLHTTCDHGYYSDTSQVACDESYSMGGSYAIEAEYNVKISRSSRINPSIRQSSRANAIELLVERFNKLPLGISKGAVLVTKSSEYVFPDVLFYDGETATPLRPLLHDTDRIFQSKGILKVFNASKKTVTTFTDGVNPGPIKENFEFRGDEAGQYLDTYSHGMISCNLFTHGVDCDFSGRRVILPINDFTPIGFWSYAPISSSDNLIYIMSSERRVYTLSADSRTFSSSRTSSLNGGNWSKRYFINLSFDGKISFLDKKTGKFDSDTPGLAPSSTFTKMITPYYWSRALQTL